MKVVERGDVEPLQNKKGAELTNVSIGLGWHAAGARIGSDPFDLDVSLAMLDVHGKAHKGDDLIFYKRREALGGTIYHSGDNTYGAEDNDEDDQEVITIKDLNLIPAQYTTLRIAASVHKATLNHYNFGMVENAYLRVLDNDGDRQMLRYNLSGDFYDASCVIVADLRRDRSTWAFEVVGRAVEGGFGELVRSYGFEPRGAAA